MLLITTGLWGQSFDEGNVISEVYSITDYNAGPINRAIAQNSEGLLFFGNNYGILKYDGEAWESLPFLVKEGIAGISVLCKNDRVYAGSQSEFGFFEQDLVGQLNYHSLTHLLPEEERHDFREILNIWEINEFIVFHSYERLFVYQNNTLQSFSLSKFNASVAAINNKIFLVNNHQELFSFDGNQFQKELDLNINYNIYLKGVTSMGKGKLLFFTENQIFIYDQLSIQPWPALTTIFPPTTKINSVIKDLEGNLFIGTRNQGIIVLDRHGRLLNVIDTSNGLKSNRVNYLFMDQFNSIWASHNNGLTRIDYDLPFSIFDGNMGVIGTGHTAASKNGKLYLGTNNGLFVKNGTTAIDSKTDFTMITGSNGIVHELFAYRDKLLMGHENGIFEVVSNNELELIAPTRGAWKIAINKRFPENLYVGGYYGIYLLKPDSKACYKLKGFDEASRIMEFDEKGYLWVTHGLKGIFRLELSPNGNEIKQVTFYGKKDGLPSNYHANVFKISEEVLFTANSGIYEFNYEKDAFEQYHKYDNFLDQSLHLRELEEDNLGNIYYWSQEESGVLAKIKDNVYEKTTKPFNKILTLVDDGIVEFTAIDSENIFLGANEGFIKYNPQKKTVHEDSFRTIIREVQLFSHQDSLIFKNYGNNSMPKIPKFNYENNSLRFKYSGVFYADKEELKYQYSLVGIDKDWSGWSNKSEKEYINLPNGKYEFKVRARNIYGSYSNVENFPFEILAPWYRNKIALIIYFIFSTAFIFVLFRSVRKKHKTEKRIIEERSEMEISKKNSALETVSKKSEEVIVSLKNEKLQAEINHKNKELATSTLNLLNKNKLLSEIKTKLINASSKNQSEISNQDIKAILSDIDHNIADDSDWEHFEYHFDLVHGDFSKRLRKAYPNLSPQDMKIATYLRMNLSTKEITQLLNISLRGVEKARYRLRKKLDMERTNNLTEFILNF